MRGRMLVVDGDPLVRAAVGGQLEAAGHTVSEASDASGALDRIKSEPLDVLLMSWDGSDPDEAVLLATAVGEPALAVVVMTATGDVEPAIEAGATDFLRKPIQSTDLRARASAALRLSRANQDVKATRIELQDAARTDHLTGLANRRHLDEHLRMTTSAARRQKQELSLLVVDVDHFKRVNDAEGHAAGDEVLRAIASRVTHVLRGEDMAGRWGGEEFLVLAPATDIDGAWRLGERIREAVSRTPLPLSTGKDVLVTVSIGCATGSGDDIDDQLRRAESALARAKTLGRNRVCTDGR